MIMVIRTAVVFLLVISTAIAAKIPEKDAKKIHLPAAKCTFSVHKEGPQGEQIIGTNLNSELYYKIKCEPERGYCLHVGNCTVSGDGPGQQAYPIIDEDGCTKEPSLFEHVQYEDDFTAGIYNPLPIRFRGSSSAVQFFCVTTFVPSIHGKCERKLCTWNEYSSRYNKEQ
uniref:ZP domain-containing protein n=1 Tax=Ascaris lumbricoides TaxID=6252 RepID=A0A0M3I112_ASCLU